MEVKGFSHQARGTGSTPVGLGDLEDMHRKNRNQRPNNRAEKILQDKVLKVRTRLKGEGSRLRAPVSSSAAPRLVHRSVSRWFSAASAGLTGATALWTFRRTPITHRGGGYASLQGLDAGDWDRQTASLWRGGGVQRHPWLAGEQGKVACG
jgi:hypothetical protein